jgi:hypothetical protein
MADDNPYTYDDESGIMELRMVDDEFVPQLAIGTLPEAYYIDPAIDDATIEKYGMGEPYLPASFKGVRTLVHDDSVPPRPAYVDYSGVTELSRIARDAAMEYQGLTPVETLGLDPRVFASGRIPYHAASGVFIGKPTTQEQIDKYPNTGDDYRSDLRKILQRDRDMLAKSDRPRLADEPDVIYMPRETDLYNALEPSLREESEVAMHEAAHRGFNILRKLMGDVIDSVPTITVNVGPEAIKNAEGFEYEPGKKVPNFYARRAMYEGKFKPEEGTRELDEESFVRLFDLERLRYIDPNEPNSLSKERAKNYALDYFQGQFGRDGYELLNNPKIRGALMRFQKIATDVMENASDDVFGDSYGYEFPPSKLNLPSYEDLQRMHGSRDFEVPMVDPLGRTDDR